MCRQMSDKGSRGRSGRASRTVREDAIIHFTEPVTFGFVPPPSSPQEEEAEQPWPGRRRHLVDYRASRRHRHPSGGHVGRCCDGTSQVIRPTYSCPCLTDIRHPVDVPKSLDKFGIFFLTSPGTFHPSCRHYKSSEIKKCGSDYINFTFI